VRDQDRLVGENTEGKALLAALRTRLDPAGKRVVILGAGQVARAIAVELANVGPAQITVVNRNEYRGRRLAELLAGRLQVPAVWTGWQEEFQVPADTDVLIHTTPVGWSDPEAHSAVVLGALFVRPMRRAVRRSMVWSCSWAKRWSTSAFGRVLS
jgi:shikimate dehydrogenase